MTQKQEAEVERLWQSARYLPQTVRLLGTRYRALFVAYAQQHPSKGEARAVADAMAFVHWMLRQDRVGLMPLEQKALRGDETRLRRRFRLKRDGASVSAVEKWKITQWLGL
jgi:hypothetical protein